MSLEHCYFSRVGGICSHINRKDSLGPPRSATCFVHIVAIVMTAIMIYHIRSKYTAVGAF